MFQIRILDEALRELEHLEKPIAKRIVERIQWLAKNIETVKPMALSHDLSGFFKLRVGDYRVIYEIQRPKKTVLIHLIGHRSNIYKRLQKG